MTAARSRRPKFAPAPGAWPEPHLLSAAGRVRLDLRLAGGPQAPAAADLPATVLCRVLPLDPARRTLATLVVGARADRAAVAPSNSTAFG